MTAAETMLRPITPPGGVVHRVDPGPELKRGAWANFIAMLASNFRGVFTFLLARLLGPAALGVFSVAWATTDLVSKIGIFGLDDTIITFIARAEAAGDRSRSRSLFRLAVFLAVGQCTLLAAISIALVRLVGARFGLDHEMADALSVMFCAMPVIALYRINTAVSRGMKVMRHDIFSRGITETIVTTVAFLVALSFGLRTFGPEIAVIVGMGASGIVALALAASLFRRAPRSAIPFSFSTESRRLLMYMIPKVIGRPVYSYHLAAIGFWTYALFASWTGMQRLVDGPFPAWMITASIAASILTLIPVATVGLNHHMTMQGYFGLLRYSPTLRFTVFGAFAYTIFSLMGIFLSLRSIAGYVHFTEASIAYSHIGLYAFFTMIIFGSMYYIVPRLVGREWRYATLIKLHFWSSAYGVGLMVLMLFLGGIAQGSSMHDPTLQFTEATDSVLPYLRGRSVSGMLLTIAHFIFAFHFGLMLFGLGRSASVPTFLNPKEEEAVKEHI